MIPSGPEVEERPSIELAGFGLEFAWIEDRWTHSLRLSDGLAWAEIARAVEGGDDPSRVVSPAYQGFHLQDGEDGPTLFLTGQSGPHHVSAVVSIRRVADGSIVVDADLADRCRSPIAGFAATYLVEAGPGDLVEASPNLASWRIAGRGVLSLHVDPPAQVALSEGGRRGTMAQASAGIDPESMTQRCRYRWSWTPSR